MKKKYDWEDVRYGDRRNVKGLILFFDLYVHYGMLLKE